MEPDLTGERLGERVIAGLSRLATVLRSSQWEHAGERSITPTQGQVLATIRSRGPTHVSGLADAVGVTAATMSNAVSTLQGKGLVTKQVASDDARRVEVILTAAGRREADRAGHWTDVLLAGVDVLEEDEREVFLRALVKMIRTLQVEGRIPVARTCVTCRFFDPHVHPDQRAPHHCNFVDAAFGDAGLQLDCPDQQPVDGDGLDDLWRRFTASATTGRTR